MPQKFADAARALLSAGITSSDTSISIASGGSLFPVADTGASAITASTTTDWFKAVLQAEDGFEIVTVRTHTSGATSFTNVLRGQDGTTARAFATGDVIGIRPLSADANAWTNLRVPRTSSTGSAQLPSGTTAQRDASPADGYFRLNTDTGNFEGRIAGAWVPIGASSMIESVAEFTATAGQTSFSTGYTPGQIGVFRNGRRLGAADYTATNSTSVVLTVGSVAGDHIAVVKYTAASISNAVAKSGDTMSGALNEAPPATVASAGTMDIGAQTSNNISVTGTTAITAFSSYAAGAKRTLTFAGALVLTHNGTSLILPTGANITTAAGDVAEFVSLGSGNWRCIRYLRADGSALAGVTKAYADTGAALYSPTWHTMLNL